MATRNDEDEAQRATEIQHYVRTGEYDPMRTAWPGGVIERERAADKDLVDALVSELSRRCEGLPCPVLLPQINLSDYVLQKVRPMVRGLFPSHERELVQDLLAASVVIITTDNVAAVLHDCMWLRTAWDLANLYLASMGAELLGDDAPNIVGLSSETTCYVSTEYFVQEDRFADFIVHETAHIFHNCKCYTAGLPEKRKREWLLEIDFHKRETFAYACEAYSRILEYSTGPQERKALLAELTAGPMPTDERVDGEEYLDILGEAVAARNGWKRILVRCSPG